MGKYGKLYRELQIKEFKGNYIDYKKLKQKIKKMEKILPRTSQGIIERQRTSNIESIKMNIRPSLPEDDSMRNSSTANTIYDKYGAEFKEFKELLDEEFKRCYNYFKKIKRQLHNKINRHLYTQTSYASYGLDDIIKEIGNLRLTMYLAKCLNAFVNDNMMAIKKILKKFDKKFNNYFGNLGPMYILDNLCMQNSDLEYILQFKVIDETSCIIESNVKSLREYYLEAVASSGDNSKNVDFFQKYNEILEYIKDIDELIYFKIQYKEWFYFRKKDTIVMDKSNLYKNIMYNPILFSAYHKDDLMHKFLPRKEQIKEIEEIQPPLSLRNRINIILIFIHTFFYNTLISGIYPLLFILMRKISIKDINYTFLIISSTYISYYFSILFYHCFGIIRIKCAYIFSYILFFIGSLLYIISYQERENNDYPRYKHFALGLLVTSRVFIGLGANPTMGKNYILSYASKYFLPSISKYYVFFSILGHSFGPFIGFILYVNGDKYKSKLLPYIYYSNYNCIGWYGAIFSFFFGLIYIIFFTSPGSQKFKKTKTKIISAHKGKINRDTNFLADDAEDTEDKEFYKLQKEIKKKKARLDTVAEEDNDSINSLKKSSTLTNENNNKDIINTTDDMDVDIPIPKTNTLEEDTKNMDMDLNNKKYEINPILIYNENQKDNLAENDKNDGNFVNINMIPRAIEELVRKEKTKFSYLNSNLLIILILLFFNNLLKENFIAYCSYYTAKNFNKSKFKLLFEPKYFCCLISGSYLLELFSMVFILPFYKINNRLKKFLIILMVSTIILMIPLSFEIDLFFYFIIISVIIIISSIIEVLSSCYLAYLTPPDWKVSHINAGALPLYIMTFGKLAGCLTCLMSFINIKFLNHLNNPVIIVFTFIGYGICGFFIIRSKELRIKAIARIMRKSELETNDY